MTDAEVNQSLQRRIEEGISLIIKLQDFYCKRLISENTEGNLGTAEDHLDFITALQKLLNDF